MRYRASRYLSAAVLGVCLALPPMGLIEPEPGPPGYLYSYGGEYWCIRPLGEEPCSALEIPVPGP